MHSNGLAAILALISALLIAVGTVWRHRILRAGQARTEANDAPLTSLRKPAWWLSVGVALLAYAFQAAALAFGSLLVVQPILVLSLMLTLLLSAHVARTPMSRAEAFWAVVLTVAVGCVVIVGKPVPGTRAVAAWEWVAVCAAAALGTAGAFAFASRRSPQTKALTYGLACGAIYGLLAVFAKVAMDALARGGVVALLTCWQFWAVVVSALAGVVVQQYAFGAGDLATSLPASKVGEPVVALALGYALLGEEFAVRPALMLVPVAVMLVAALQLTRAAVR
ncbi:MULTISPECIES: DMT family transporter [Corynebacterium]|uniref:DMT family transporter n=1 Tax=Corynebacterium TaxID=1716 RepID=UPI001F46E50F|nr:MULTISPECIES: DMT family transporter [Corynebacterium]